MPRHPRDRLVAGRRHGGLASTFECGTKWPFFGITFTALRLVPTLCRAGPCGWSGCRRVRRSPSHSSRPVVPGPVVAGGTPADQRDGLLGAEISRAHDTDEGPALLGGDRDPDRDRVTMARRVPSTLRFSDVEQRPAASSRPAVSVGHGGWPPSSAEQAEAASGDVATERRRVVHGHQHRSDRVVAEPRRHVEQPAGQLRASDRSRPVGGARGASKTRLAPARSVAAATDGAGPAEVRQVRARSASRPRPAPNPPAGPVPPPDRR